MDYDYKYNVGPFTRLNPLLHCCGRVMARNFAPQGSEVSAWVLIPFCIAAVGSLTINEEERAFGEYSLNPLLHCCGRVMNICATAQMNLFGSLS